MNRRTFLTVSAVALAAPVIAALGPKAEGATIELAARSTQPLCARLECALDRRRAFGFQSKAILLSASARRALLRELDAAEQVPASFGHIYVAFRGVPCYVTRYCKGDDFVITDFTPDVSQL